MFLPKYPPKINMSCKMFVALFLSVVKELRADLTIVADGGFSRLRGVNVDGKPTNCGHFIGLEHRGPLGKPGYLMVYTTPQSAVIVYQISEDTTRILTDVRGNMPKDLKQYLRDQVQDVPCKYTNNSCLSVMTRLSLLPTLYQKQANYGDNLLHVYVIIWC